MKAGRRVDFLAWRDADNASARCRGQAYTPYLAELGWRLRFQPPAPRFLARLLNPRRGPLRVPAKLLYMLIALVVRLTQVLSAQGADAVVVQRELLNLGPPFLERLLAQVNPRLIYDLDDALDLAPPHLRRLGAGLRDMDKPGRIAALSCRVVASTTILAERMADSGTPIIVIPTPVDLRCFPAPESEATGPLRLGWFGTGGNLSQLTEVAPALRRVQAETDCELWVVSEWDFGFPGLRVENRRWRLAEEVPLLLSCHVGLMPLADNAYTRAKAGFKILQHWAAARPVVASPVGFNRELVADGEDGLLATGEEEWVAALLRLAGDADLRRRLGLSGRAKVERHFSQATCAGRWADLLVTVAGD